MLGTKHATQRTALDMYSKWTAHSLFVMFAAAMLVAATGCNNNTRNNNWFKQTFKRSTPEQIYKTALEDPHPGARREAILQIGDGHHTSDRAFEVLDHVARYDENAQVRCAAIRVLRKYYDQRPVATMLAILTAKSQSETNQAAPATGEVRWDASMALRDLLEAGLIPPDDKDATRDTFVDLLLNDPKRDVRITAAEALAMVQDERVVRALIATLRDRDFGIAYTAHESLFRLTGQDFRYDVDAWQEWLSKTNDPFDRNVTTQPAATNL